MLTTAELLVTIEKQKNPSLKQLAQRLKIPEEYLHEVLTTLNKHKIVEYDSKSGKVALPKWLTNIDKKIEATKPTTGEIILPKYQEIQIQDVLIGNYTREDLELKIWFKAKRKEIAICLLT